jgi:hypothetical protein
MVKFVNLHYIRAAILAGTGIKLSLRKTAQYLVSEGLITDAKAKQALNFSFNIYHPVSQSDKPLDNPIPIDVSMSTWTDVDENEIIYNEDD